MIIRDNDTPVLVLRLDHHGSLGVIRSLGRLGVAVYGLHRDDHALALRSRYVRGGFVWDLDDEPESRSVARLLEIAGELGGRPVLLPSNDETALFVSAHADRLRPAFRFQDNPASLVRALYDKKSMYHLARQHDIPTAETLFPASLEEVRAFAATCRYPVMLKGSDGIRLSHRTGEKMVIVRSAGELLERYDQMENFARPDLMLQEYIPGGEDAQWMWNGYFGHDGECRFSVTGQKLRQTPPFTGMTSLGICRHNPEVDALTRRFMKALGYRGILDIGYRWDARDGRYKVLDVNPRIGATFRLFLGEDGMDVARALYLDLTGQEVPASLGREGRKWFVEDLDFVSSLKYGRAGKLRVNDWLRSFRGVQEAAWYAADDLAPFRGMCARFAGQLVRKVGKKLHVVPPATPRPPRAKHQAEVTHHFARSARYWRRVYQEQQLDALVYRHRQEAALRWVDEVALPPGAQVLELGCGAGHAAVALAQRGYRVHALDAAPKMIHLAREAAASAGVRSFEAAVGDAHALSYGDGSFDLVLALGLLPWLHSEARGLAEMARVLKTGGWLIATADNRAPLHRLLDPRSTPALAPLRAVAKRVLGRAGEGFCPAKRHAIVDVDRLVRAAGLYKVKATSVGFGPFRLLGKKLLSDETDRIVHERLQHLAWRELPLLRTTGSHYVVLARKP